MKTNKLLTLIRDHVVSLRAEILIGVLLFCVDFTVGQPLWRDVLEAGVMSPLLSGGMALLFFEQARFCGKLLARDKKAPFAAGIILFGLLQFPIFTGQELAGKQKNIEPLESFFADESDLPDETENIRHFIALCLTTSLFGLGVLISFLREQGNKNSKDIELVMEHSAQEQKLNSETIMAEGELERAEQQPDKLAQDQVNGRLEEHDEAISEYELSQQKLEGELAYAEKYYDILRSQTIAAIQAVYSKKSIFTKLFR